MIDMHKYLFVLSPPYCGSTVLWRLLHTSPAGSAHPKEGQMLDGVKHIMRDGAWDPEKKFPWAQIKARWEAVWDTNKAVLIEKSPPNIVRAFEIEKALQEFDFAGHGFYLNFDQFGKLFDLLLLVLGQFDDGFHGHAG